jgi:heptosyltransferase-2
LVYLDTKGTWVQRWPAVAWALRRWRPDLTLLMPNSHRSALVAWLAGSRRTIGFGRPGRSWMLHEMLSVARDAAGQRTPRPIINDYNRLAIAAGTPWPGHRMELFTTPADEAAADAVWQAHFGSASEVIGLNPGAAFGAAKHWPVDYFAQLAQQLVDERGSKILVLCGPGERELARQITRLCARPGVHSLADHTLSLGLTKALVRRMQLLVTTDSGPRHFAAAFDRPVVTLFGPTHIEWTETYFERALHLQKKVPCGPCQRRICPTDHRCMNELLPRDVFAAACRLLSGAPLRAA